MDTIADAQADDDMSEPGQKKTPVTMVTGVKPGEEVTQRVR